MNVSDIIRKYLVDNGYDGLFCSDQECGCELSDLIPCGGDCILGCEPGYKRKPTESEGGEFDFIIGPDKPEDEIAQKLKDPANKPSWRKNGPGFGRHG